jgi:hypothetical protein
MNLQENVAAFVNVFGVENSEVAFPFGLVDWESSDDRNKFISQIIELNNGQKVGDL